MPILTALGVLSDLGESPLPPDSFVADRLWRTSSILPMGARMTVEGLTCSEKKDKYIRININDRIMPLPFCRSGPGHSCSLDDFVKYVHSQNDAFGDYGQACGLKDHAERITFLRQD